MQKRITPITSYGLYPRAKDMDPAMVSLAMAIFTQAVRDLIAPQKRTDKDWMIWQADARRWFDDESLEPGTFHWVCQMTGLEPASTRRRIIGFSGLTNRQIQSLILSLIRVTYTRKPVEDSSEREALAS